MKQVTALTDDKFANIKSKDGLFSQCFFRKEINVLEKTSYEVLKRPE